MSIPKALLILGVLVILGYGATLLIPVISAAFWYAICGICLWLVLIGIILIFNHGAALLRGKDEGEPRA